MLTFQRTILGHIFRILKKIKPLKRNILFLFSERKLRRLVSEPFLISEPHHNVVLSFRIHCLHVFFVVFRREVYYLFAISEAATFSWVQGLPFHSKLDVSRIVYCVSPGTGPCSVVIHLHSIPDIVSSISARLLSSCPFRTRSNRNPVWLTRDTVDT